MQQLRARDASIKIRTFLKKKLFLQWGKEKRFFLARKACPPLLILFLCWILQISACGMFCCRYVQPIIWVLTLTRFLPSDYWFFVVTNTILFLDSLEIFLWIVWYWRQIMKCLGPTMSNCSPSTCFFFSFFPLSEQMCVGLFYGEINFALISKK